MQCIPTRKKTEAPAAGESAASHAFYPGASLRENGAHSAGRQAGRQAGDAPSCALQLSMVLSRLSWNRLRICRLGEMRGTGADCWTDSLSSFKSISALLRSGRHHHILVRTGTRGTASITSTQVSRVVSVFLSFNHNSIPSCPETRAQAQDNRKHMAGLLPPPEQFLSLIPAWW